MKRDSQFKCPSFSRNIILTPDTNNMVEKAAKGFMIEEKLNKDSEKKGGSL